MREYYVNTSEPSGGKILGFVKSNVLHNHILTYEDYKKAQTHTKFNTLTKEGDTFIFSFVEYSNDNDLTEKEIRNLIQSHLDEESKKWGYDNIYTAVGYRGDPNIEFNQEAEMFFKWRSAVWTYTNDEMDKVKAGNRDMPTIDDDITSELPKIEDYE